MSKNPIERHADAITELCLYEGRKVLDNVRDLSHLDALQEDALYFAVMRGLQPTDALVKSMCAYVHVTLHAERQTEDSAKVSFEATLNFSENSPLTKLGVTKEQVEQYAFTQPSAEKLAEKAHTILRQLKVSEDDLKKNIG